MTPSLPEPITQTILLLFELMVIVSMTYIPDREQLNAPRRFHTYRIFLDIPISSQGL